MPFIIAADIGTTHCKLLLVNEQGKTVHSFKAAVVSLQPSGGWHEQDPALIFQSVAGLLRQAFSVVDAAEVGCVVFSAAMHSLLAVDANGNQLTNAITWADTRSKAYAKQLRETAEGQEFYMQTGTPLHAMSPLCKLLWLRQEQPDVFQQAHKFVSVKEYIFNRLFDRYVVDEGIASSSGLYDIYNHCWSAAALQLAGIDETRLSQVVEPTHAIYLSPAAKALLGLEKDIPFIAGGTDGCLANLGCAALEPGVAVITTGTSGAVRATIQNPVKGDMHGLFRYILTKDYYITGGGTNNAGIVLKWFADQFMPSATGNNIDDALLLAATVPAGSDGLLFLPYLLGERAPVYDESAAGVFSGIKMQHSKAHFARAVVEGITFSLVQVLYALETTYHPVNSIYASGAITQSAWWMQLLADVSGRPVIYQDAPDASALGAAMLGMYATGVISSLGQSRQFFTASTVFHPDLGLHTVYSRQYQAYTRLYPQLKDCF